MDSFSTLAQKEKALMFLEGKEFNRVIYAYYQFRDTEVS